MFDSTKPYKRGVLLTQDSSVAKWPRTFTTSAHNRKEHPMASHGNTLEVGQFANLAAAVTKALPRNISHLDARLMAANGEGLADVLSRALRPINVLSQLKTWKTVTVGAYESLHEYERALRQENRILSSGARDLLRKKMTISGTQRKLDLVRVSPTQLGLRADCTYNDVCNRALELGLHLCDLEIGLALQLEHAGRFDDMLYVSMHPYLFEREQVILRLSSSLENKVSILELQQVSPFASFANPSVSLVFVRPQMTM